MGTSMVRFLKLTRTNGREVLINESQIVHIQASDPDGNFRGSDIYTAEDFIQVKESFIKIADKLNVYLDFSGEPPKGISKRNPSPLRTF